MTTLSSRQLPQQRVSNTAPALLIALAAMTCTSGLTACQSRADQHREPAQVFTSFRSPSDAYAALEGEWRLVELRGQSVLETLEAGGFDSDRPPTISITRQGGMGGFGGINRLVGTIDADRISRGTLVFAGGGAAMTMMAGPPELMELEQGFVKELSAGRSIRLIADRLTLIDESESPTAVLERSR